MTLDALVTPTEPDLAEQANPKRSKNDREENQRAEQTLTADEFAIGTLVIVSLAAFLFNSPESLVQIIGLFNNIIDLILVVLQDYLFVLARFILWIGLVIPTATLWAIIGVISNPQNNLVELYCEVVDRQVLHCLGL